jgi:5'-methylthioadenosine phosphorylase
MPSVRPRAHAHRIALRPSGLCPEALALRIGLIGGTGLYQVGGREEIPVETPFGETILEVAKLAGAEVFFLPRHGKNHELPPHGINYRANVAALKSARCDYVVAINNVGSVDASLRTGDLAVVEDFVDLHRAQIPTFFQERAVHVDFSAPYCPTVSQALAATARPRLRSVVYAGTDGPRFETRAEIAHIRSMGAHVVGMTGVPEVILAHEQGLCYACLVFVGNDGATSSTAKTIQKRMASRGKTVVDTVAKAIRRLPAKKSCHCADAARNADLTLRGAS